jgi:hypothetical protein
MEQRSVIRFLWAEGVLGAQIHIRMYAQYGDKFLSHRIMYDNGLKCSKMAARL